jgi:hypothetical protein
MEKMVVNFVKSGVEKDVATNLYFLLKDNVNWTNGVPSRRYGRSRYQAHLEEQYLLYETVMPILENIIKTYFPDIRQILSVYLNYYADGNDCCPSHKHEDTQQIILSFSLRRACEEE